MTPSGSLFLSRRLLASAASSRARRGRSLRRRCHILRARRLFRGDRLYSSAIRRARSDTALCNFGAPPRCCKKSSRVQKARGKVSTTGNLYRAKQKRRSCAAPEPRPTSCLCARQRSLCLPLRRQARAPLRFEPLRSEQTRSEPAWHAGRDRRAAGSVAWRLRQLPLAAAGSHRRRTLCQGRRAAAGRNAHPRSCRDRPIDDADCSHAVCSAADSHRARQHGRHAGSALCGAGISDRRDARRAPR